MTTPIKVRIITLAPASALTRGDVFGDCAEVDQTRWDPLP